MEQLLYSRKESGKILGLSIRSIEELNRSGALPVVRIGRRCLIHADVLREFAEDGHYAGVRSELPK